MLDAALELAVVFLADNHVHVSAMLINDRLPQRREIRGRQAVSLSRFDGQKHYCLAPHRRSNPFGISDLQRKGGLLWINPATA